MTPRQFNILFPSLDREARNFFARVDAVGSIGAQSQRAVNRAVKALKAASLWTKFRRLNFCVGDSLASSLIPLINASGAAADTNGGSAMLESDYSEALGWQTNGTSKHIDTGHTPSEATGSLHCYLRTQQAGVGFMMGARDIGSTDLFRIRASSAGANIQCSWGKVVTCTAATSPATGLLSGCRTSSTAMTLYRSGASLNTAATSTTPAATSTLFIMAINTSAAAAGYLDSGSRVSGYAVDDGMTAAQVLIFSNIMQTLQTAYGRQV